MVVASLRVAGFHRWHQAPEAFEFLGARHRHEFHIRVWLETSFAREVEFIDLKEKVTAYLRHYYAGLEAGGPLEFGDLSCETIAAELIGRFDLAQCEVLEDGENGALVVRTRDE